MSTVDPESSPQGAGLRQSHFGSGYDAGKARLQAEVEQLKAEISIQDAVIEAARKATGSILASHAMGCGYLAIPQSEGRCPCGNRDLRAALARLDAWRKGESA